MKTALILAGLLLAVGCAPKERYDLIRSEKGLVRIDRVTGEMVSVDQHHRASPIELPQSLAADTELSKLRDGPKIEMDMKRKLTISMQYRWVAGRIEYRVALSPFAADSVSLNASGGGNLSLVFCDRDGFQIARVDPMFSLGYRDGAGGDSVLVHEESMSMTRADYVRIASVRYIGKAP